MTQTRLLQLKSRIPFHPLNLSSKLTNLINGFQSKLQILVLVPLQSFLIMLTLVAMWKDHHFKGIIQPEALRAPEVILGLRWDTSVDIWSFACVVRRLSLEHMIDIL